MKIHIIKQLAPNGQRKENKHEGEFQNDFRRISTQEKEKWNYSYLDYYFALDCFGLYIFQMKFIEVFSIVLLLIVLVITFCLLFP